MSDIYENGHNYQRVVVGTRSDSSIIPYLTRDEVTLPLNTETVLFTLKNTSTDKFIKMGTLLFIARGGTKPVKIRIYNNSVLNGTYGPFGTYNEGKQTSVVDLSIDTTLNYTVENPVPGVEKRVEQIGGTLLLDNDRERINLLDSDVSLFAKPGDSLTFTAESSANSEAFISLRWLELDEL